MKGRYQALIYLFLASLMLQGHAAAPGNETLSRYHRTVHLLQQTPPAVQNDFAKTALGQLAEVYIAEADLARYQASNKPRRGKLMSWSRAVDQYTNELMLALEEINQGFPAVLSRSQKGIVSVSVGGRVVILSHPRADQQSAYEQRVLRDFCSRRDCGTLAVATLQQQPIPLSSSLIDPSWTFTERAAICSHDGISLIFANAADLANSRTICGQLLHEALSLAIEIAWQQRHGVSVDWRVLKILAVPQSPEHRVHLNFAGDSILETLPLLYGSPGLLQDIEPWLKTRFADKGRQQVTLQASRYGWEGAGE